MESDRTFRIVTVRYGMSHIVISGEPQGKDPKQMEQVDLACSRHLDLWVGFRGRFILSNGTAENVTCSVCRKNSGLDDSVVLRKPGKRRKV